MVLCLFRVLLVDLLNCSQHCTKLKSRVDSANGAVVIASVRTIAQLAVALVRNVASWPSETQQHVGLNIWIRLGPVLVLLVVWKWHEKIIAAG